MRSIEYVWVIWTRDISELTVARKLVGLAEDLYQAYLDNKVDDAFDAVLKAALSLGVVERGE
jgi:hypothetical protein